MPRYQYQTSYFHKRSHARRVGAVASVVVLIVMVASAWIGIDWLMSRQNNSQQSQSTSVAVQSETVKGFRSEYFEFQASQNWQEIYDERRPNRFVFRRFNGPLVEDEFIIEIGSQSAKPLSAQTSNRVLAVLVGSDGSLTPEGIVSDHCEKVYPESSFAQPKLVKMNQVDFLCNPNSTQYHVLLGVSGGSTSIIMPRLDGKSAAYFMEYRSFRTNPDGNDLLNILSTFKSR